jgi:hypothetical protein
MHPDIRDISPQRHEVLAQLERRRNPDRLDHNITPDPVRRFHHRGDRLGGIAAQVRAHGFGGGEAGWVVVDHDDLRGRVEFGGEERAQADGAGADDGDGFSGGDGAGEDADFVAGGDWGCDVSGGL